MQKDWFFKAFKVLGFLLLIILAISIEVNSQTYDAPHNGKCKLQNGENGVCIPLRHCPDGLENFRKDRRKYTCWIRGYVPYVCCDPKSESRPFGEKTKNKCREWYPEKRNFWYGAPLVGGFRSLSKEFPHMAALGYADGDETKWACGGSLISNKFVLTAAHCIKNKELGAITKVRLGDLNLKLETDDASPKDFTVNNTYRHPEFKSSSQYHDVALIELNDNVEFTDYIRPACLQTDKHFGYYELIATGWGNLEYTGPPAEHLQKVYLDIYDNHICNDFYKDANKRKLSKGIDDRSQICAGGYEKDTCQGDSGGPLQVRNQEYVEGYTIVGITSFGKACGLSESPGVYTRVSNYIKWIESVVWPN